jgi:hypothetical protein
MWIASVNVVHVIRGDLLIRVHDVYMRRGILLWRGRLDSLTGIVIDILVEIAI